MAKTLDFEYEGKEYRLEFTRKSIERMERNGFVASDLTDKPMTTLPALFAGAFIANHPFIKKETVDKIYDNMKNKGGLIGKLAEMYREPLEALFDDDADEDDGKKIQWEANW